ncbi:hypothetical protein KH017_07805 [bacterium]|nr:hypothetical protein [bacterium]
MAVKPAEMDAVADKNQVGDTMIQTRSDPAPDILADFINKHKKNHNIS